MVVLLKRLAIFEMTKLSVEVNYFLLDSLLTAINLLQFNVKSFVTENKELEITVYVKHVCIQTVDGTSSIAGGGFCESVMQTVVTPKQPLRVTTTSQRIVCESNEGCQKRYLF